VDEKLHYNADKFIVSRPGRFLFREKEFLMPMEWKAGWAAEPVWSLGRGEKPLPPPEAELTFLGCRVHS